jgi:flagellar biosynthesis protein FlhF
MELQRILAKDSRTAMERVHTLYGKDALVVSNKRAKDKTELIVAVDLDYNAESVLNEMQLNGEQRNTETIKKNANFEQVMESKIFKTSSNNVPEVTNTTFLSALPNAPKIEVDIEAEEREKVKSREIVDLVKQELAVMRREFKLSQQVEAWTGTHAVAQKMRPLIEALNATGMPIPLRTLVTDIINQNEILGDVLGDITNALGENLDHTEILSEMQGIHVIAGSSGAGKTLMTTRIARQKAIEYGEHAVAIISFNDSRFGAWSQKLLLSAQAGVEVYRANSLDTLDQLLVELNDRKLILIDTNGMDTDKTMQTLAAHLPIVQKHLVLAADTSEDSANKYLKKAHGNWNSVMLSRLEKGTFPWPVINALLNENVQLSLVSASPSALESALPITGPGLIRSILDQLNVSFV